MRLRSSQDLALDLPTASRGRPHRNPFGKLRAIILSEVSKPSERVLFVMLVTISKSDIA